MRRSGPTTQARRPPEGHRKCIGPGRGAAAGASRHRFASRGDSLTGLPLGCCGPQIRVALLPTDEGFVVPRLRIGLPKSEGPGYRVTVHYPSLRASSVASAWASAWARPLANAFPLTSTSQLCAVKRPFLFGSHYDISTWRWQRNFGPVCGDFGFVPIDLAGVSAPEASATLPAALAFFQLTVLDPTGNRPSPPAGAEIETQRRDSEKLAL